MKDFLEYSGWILVLNGLLAVFVTAIVAMLRADDSPWQAFAQIYGFALLMIWVGFRLLRYVGAWPAPHANRP